MALTLIRSAIRGLLAASATNLEGELRGLLARDDDYASAGKPVCDYEDREVREVREAMIDALAKDAHALLVALVVLAFGLPRADENHAVTPFRGQSLVTEDHGYFPIRRPGAARGRHAGRRVAGRRCRAGPR